MMQSDYKLVRLFNILKPLYRFWKPYKTYMVLFINCKFCSKHFVLKIVNRLWLNDLFRLVGLLNFLNQPLTLSNQKEFNRKPHLFAKRLHILLYIWSISCSAVDMREYLISKAWQNRINFWNAHRHEFVNKDVYVYF